MNDWKSQQALEDLQGKHEAFPKKMGPSSFFWTSKNKTMKFWTRKFINNNELHLIIIIIIATVKKKKTLIAPTVDQ